MDDDRESDLLQRIEELETELRDRQRDLELYRKELISVNQRVERLLQTAHYEVKNLQKMQAVLVPTELPNLQGFEVSSKFVPSYERGGDYFDLFEHEDRLRFGIVMSSCEGYGTSSLLLSLLLKFTSRMEARKGAAPDKIVKVLLKELKDQLAPSSQVDLFYALVDRRTFEMNYCRIGEIYAFHHGVSQSGYDLLGPAQTLDEALQKVEARTVQLNPKDRMLFCTRGVTESKSLTNEVFGLDHLLKTLMKAPKRGAHELRNEVLFQLSQHQGGQSPTRDQTLLVLEVNDRVIKLA